MADENMMLQALNKKQDDDLLAQALLPALSTLGGYLAGGFEGGAAGAQAGVKGLDIMSAQKKAQRESELEDAKLYGQYGIKKDQSGQYMLDSGSAAQSNKADENLKKQLEIKKLQMEIGEKSKEAAMKDTPEGKLKKMSGEDRKRLDSASMGMRAVQDMAKALEGGATTFSLVGDNPYTLSRRDFEEAIGRMQSGGAISKDEEARFRQMAPRPTDNSAIQREKLLKLQDEMARRIKTMGLKPQDLGIEQYEITYGQKKEPSMMKQEAVAKPPKEKPAKVIQNGVEYILNPKTGNYE